MIGKLSVSRRERVGGANSAQLDLHYFMQICSRLVPRPTHRKAAYLHVAGARGNIALGPSHDLNPLGVT